LISLEEFVGFRATLDTEKAAIFQRLDLDGDGYISGDELVELFRQFVLSDDPDAPGNLWYGSSPVVSSQ
jgi:Ca2+-binding EF-hand superfamily protein